MLVQLGQKTIQKAGAAGSAEKNLVKNLKHIATNSVHFPEPYIADIPLGQCAGHPPMEVDYHLLLPHEVLYH